MWACVYLCSKHSLHRLEQLVCVVSERACILFKHTEQGPRLQTQDAYNSPYSHSEPNQHLCSVKHAGCIHRCVLSGIRTDFLGVFPMQTKQATGRTPSVGSYLQHRALWGVTQRHITPTYKVNHYFTDNISSMWERLHASELLSNNMQIRPNYDLQDIAMHETMLYQRLSNVFCVSLDASDLSVADLMLNINWCCFWPDVLIWYSYLILIMYEDQTCVGWTT